MALHAPPMPARYYPTGQAAERPARAALRCPAGAYNAPGLPPHYELGDFAGHFTDHSAGVYGPGGVTVIVCGVFAPVMEFTDTNDNSSSIESPPVKIYSVVPGGRFTTVLPVANSSR